MFAFTTMSLVRALIERGVDETDALEISLLWARDVQWCETAERAAGQLLAVAAAA